MTSLMKLPVSSNAFSEYRPSKNAHTDFLGQSTLGKRKDDQSGPRIIKLSLPPQPAPRSVGEDLGDVVTALPALLNGQSTNQSYHQISASCHRIVISDQGERLYSQVQKQMEKEVETLARGWKGGIMGREGNWLGRLVEGWNVWQARVNLLSAVLTYLDRVYAVSAKVPWIKEMGITAFREGVWNSEVLKSKTRDDLLTWVSSERSTSRSDSEQRLIVKEITSIAKILSSFHTLSDPYLESVGWYFTDEVEEKIQKVDKGQLSPGGYILWVIEQVEEETKRAKECLDGDVAISAVKIVQFEAGFKRRDQIIRKALDEGMDGQDQSALKRLYKFSVDCNVFSDLVVSLREHVKSRLTRLISNPENDSRMIEGTLTLKRFVDKTLAGLFEIDSTSEEERDSDERSRELDLEDAVRVGFKEGIGSRQNAPAEWIAKHLDSAMRKGQGSGTEAEFNTLLDEIISLVGYTKDKDVFKAFYSTQLAKRLLLNKSASDDMERTMILKLQNEMGEEFTSGDVMMKDLALSETLVKSYQQAQSKNPDQFTDPGAFTANVLTESAWPAYPLLKDGWNFKLTPELQTSIDQFTQWYSAQHKNRQLSWRWQLATVSLTARFPSGRYEVGVSLFQAVALLQFNSADSLTFKELKDQTGIEHSELVRTVQSLAMGRKTTRVLVKKPPGKEVNPEDMFMWNKGFTSDRVKFKINSIQQDLSTEESKQTNEQIAIDRVSVLEATIVRIMKGKKTMTLQLLIDAVVTEVSKRFPPDIKDLKKRVESLIEREFLIRDEEDRNVINYLA